MKNFASLKAAIVGRAQDTSNYEKALAAFHIETHTLLSIGSLHNYDFLVLPGGGDITPGFFGQKNCGSKKIDTELDILQIQALEVFVSMKRPVLGICKGIQIINVFFGGNLFQDLPSADHHKYNLGDQYHLSSAVEHSLLHSIYGSSFVVNSAHHQGIDLLGKSLTVIQHSDDGIIEGLIHNSLPILGVQWHPERMMPPPLNSPCVDGSLLFETFLSRSFFP